MSEERDWTGGRLPHQVINEAMAKDPLHPTVDKAVKKYKRTGCLNDYDYAYLDAVRVNPANQLIKPHPDYLTIADARSVYRIDPYQRHLDAMPKSAETASYDNGR